MIIGIFTVVSDTLTPRSIVGLLLLGVVTTGCARPTAPALSGNAEVAMAMRAILDAKPSEASGDTSTVQAEPTGWATLAGQFRLEGSAPSPLALNVDKDTEVCAAAGKQIFSESLVVGSTGGIRGVLIYATTKFPEGNPKWEHESYAATRNAEIEFDQKNCVFLTHVFAVRTTQNVKVLNSDPIGHNTNIQPRRGANAFNQTIPANGYAAYQPGGESPDPFPVSCSIHPWMSAYMITRENPLFAVTDAEGKFQITNVPAGVELEFRVWQEKASYLQNVTVNGQATTWSKGRVAVTLNPDERRELDVVVQPAAFQ